MADQPKADAAGDHTPIASFSLRLLGWMIVAQGALNAAVGPALLGLRHGGIELSEWLGLAWMAAIAGQLAVISAWLCWSRAPLRTRLLRFAGLWCGIVSSVLLATVVASPSDSVRWNDMQLTGIIFFLSTVAVQLPLWILRFAARLRIDTPATNANPPIARQVSIADLLALTAAVAILLAIGRFLPKPDEPYFWPIALTIMGIIAVATLLTVPAAAWVMSKDYELGFAILFTLSYLAIACVILLVITALAAGGSPTAAGAGFVPIVLGYGATLTTFLTAARMAGWRLVSDWRRNRSPKFLEAPQATQPALFEHVTSTDRAMGESEQL